MTVTLLILNGLLTAYLIYSNHIKTKKVLPEALGEAVRDLNEHGFIVLRLEPDSLYYRSGKR